MLTNLPFQNLNTVVVQFNLPISYVLLFFDSSGLVEYHRQRNISAHLIQKNWKRYKTTPKWDNSDSFPLNTDPDYYKHQPSGSPNSSHSSCPTLPTSRIAPPAYTPKKIQMDIRKKKVLNRLRRKLNKSKIV